MNLRVLLSLLLPLLLSLSAHAQQTTISGRVTEQDTGAGVPGATILQLNTPNGISSDADGYFTLSVPGVLDSVTLTVSSIGFVRQQQRVAAGSVTTFGLALSHEIFCELKAFYRFEVGLSAGVRYAPFGGLVQLFGFPFIRVPANLTLGYQTNGSRNHALLGALTLPPLLQHNRFTVTESLHYQQLQAAPADVRFRSYSATVGMGIYRIGSVLVPDLLLGSGFSRRQRLASGETAATAGYGYSVGLRRNLGYPFRALVQAQATRWPGYWQLQGSLVRPIGNNYRVGVAANQLGQYSEYTVSFSRCFY
jgi:hypothetical protein